MTLFVLDVDLADGIPDLVKVSCVPDDLLVVLVDDALVTRTHHKHS